MALLSGALNVITTVKYEASLINAVNKMTFLFDPNWQANGSTLPLAFFFVKDFKEVMESEVSQKPLLFYNSQTENNPDSVSGGLLGIVSDNLINKPKKYQMSVIIPNTLTDYLRQSVFTRRASLGEAFHNKALVGIEQFTALSSEMLLDLMATLNVLPVKGDRELDLSTLVSNALSASVEDSNKASIEAMWENRTILRMKYWNGWKFKYVAIESYTPSKQGDEDNVYEATLNLVEIPILTTRKEGSALASRLPQTHLSSANVFKTENISNFLDKLEYAK